MRPRSPPFAVSAGSARLSELSDSSRPALAAIGGGATSGIFLAQLLYWHDKAADPDGWIYKTQDEWEEETGLTRREHETARRKLRDLGILEERLAGIPARLHDRLDVDEMIRLLAELRHLMEHLHVT